MDKTKTLQILHISDLHINDTKEQKFDRSVVLEPLIERIKQDHGNNFHPEIIVVTGDIAFKGIKAEYDLAKVFFDDLLAALDLKSDRLFLVPGNHDVNRDKYRPTDIPKYNNMHELNTELENQKLGIRYTQVTTTCGGVFDMAKKAAKSQVYKLYSCACGQ